MIVIACALPIDPRPRPHARVMLRSEGFWTCPPRPRRQVSADERLDEVQALAEAVLEAARVSRGSPSGRASTRVAGSV
jgi:hypothetical protein